VFEKQINDYQMGKVRKSRAYKGLVSKPGFESASVKVTQDSII